MSHVRKFHKALPVLFLLVLVIAGCRSAAGNRGASPDGDRSAQIDGLSFSSSKGSPRLGREPTGRRGLHYTTPA